MGQWTGWHGRVHGGLAGGTKHGRSHARPALGAVGTRAPCACWRGSVMKRVTWQSRGGAHQSMDGDEEVAQQRLELGAKAKWSARDLGREGKWCGETCGWCSPCIGPEGCP
jgi:hypothetical protein